MSEITLWALLLAIIFHQIHLYVLGKRIDALKDKRQETTWTLSAFDQMAFQKYLQKHIEDIRHLFEDDADWWKRGKKP